jgi:hypothetical protein
METIPVSGICYPNNLSRILLLSLEDVMGINGLNTILKLAGQSDLIGNYPPNNTESEFDFATFSMIICALTDMYGQRGARVLAMRAGNAIFHQMLLDMGEPIDVKVESFQSKPLTEKIQVGLSVVRSAFSKTKSAPIPLTEDGTYSYSVKYCPVCWGRSTSTPECSLISGLLQASVRWSTNGLEFEVSQKTAQSCGNPTCDFIIPTLPSLIK